MELYFIFLQDHYEFELLTPITILSLKMCYFSWPFFYLPYTTKVHSDVCLANVLNIQKMGKGCVVLILFISSLLTSLVPCIMI